MIELYSKEACVFCTRAKILLQQNGLGYTEYRLGVHFTREHLLESFPLQKTYPVIVIDGMCIGGYDNLVKHLKENSDNTTEQYLTG
jgi:glutaredoxin